MSDKPKFDAEEAVPVAMELIAAMEPFCERIEIAGSLRRMKDRVGDIELVFIPRVESRQADFFSSEPLDLTAERIAELVGSGVLQKRPNVNGGFTWGRLNKLAIHTESDIPVDLFCEPNAADWARSMVIRTGPKELNLRLIAGAATRGIDLHAYGPGFTRKSNGEVIPCGSEREAFELCGFEYLEPNERR